jgi:hypothetical protein
MPSAISLLRTQISSDVFTDTEVAMILSGTPARRYALIKRALARGDLLQLRRGVYCFGSEYQRQAPNLFELAQKIYGPSYISLESALSFHGWIPEATYTTTSVCSKRSKDFDTPLGLFSFTRIPGCNMLGVQRLTDGPAVMLMADPSKALIDYIYVNKLGAHSLHEVASSLRIEPRLSATFSRDLLVEVADLYGRGKLTTLLATGQGGVS